MSCLFTTPVRDHSVFSSFVCHFCFLFFHVFFVLISFIFALSYLHYHKPFLNMNDEGLRDHGVISVCVCVCVCVSASSPIQLLSQMTFFIKLVETSCLRKLPQSLTFNFIQSDTVRSVLIFYNILNELMDLSSLETVSSITVSLVGNLHLNILGTIDYF